MSSKGIDCLEIVELAIRVLEDPLASDADLDEVSRHIAVCATCHDSIDCYSRTGMLAMRIPRMTRETSLELFARIEVTCHEDRAPERLVSWMHAKAFAITPWKKPGRSGAVSPLE